MKKRIVLLTIALPVLLIAFWSGTGSVDMPPSVAAAMQELPSELDYNIHVKPILSDKCFACHGPDAKKQKADLRLDDAAAAYKKETESGRKAIVPGKPGKSEIIHRILSDDPDVVMPTPDSHLSLTDREKAILIRWVNEGAQYKPHWAFVAPEMPAVPRVVNKAWPRGAIDNFILEKLEEQQLQPSVEADKETLIRRVAFDLTGLPPTLQEIDRFVADKSANAYEQMVDRYLASPHYGERMASYWLDVARYADSYGYLDDKHRDASPWRDWVISAYNRNLPFDKFVTWQMAGDLLPNATQEQILATGFNRMHKQNSEAGIIDEEFRVEYVHDRTATLGKGLLGLSLSCAQCHDHKYDPISAKDYYSLFAFFNSTNENGSPNIGETGILPGPTMLLTTQEQEATAKAIRQQIALLAQQLSKDTTTPTEASMAARVVGWVNFDKVTQGTAYRSVYSKTPEAPYTTQVFPNLVSRSHDAAAHKFSLVPGKRGQAMQIEEETFVHFPPYKFAYFERYQPFSAGFWIKLAKTYDEAYIWHHSDARRMGNLGYDMLVVNGKLNFRLSHSFPHDAISVAGLAPIDTGKWVHVAVSYDGSSKAAGVQLFLNGRPIMQEIWADNLNKTIQSHPNIHKSPYPFDGLVFGKRYLERVIIGSALDDFVVMNTALRPQDAAWLYNNSASFDKANFAKYRSAAIQAPDTILALRKRLAMLYDSIPEAMVMGDLPKPRPTFVLERGVYSEHGEQVTPNTPSAILPFDKKYPPNRLGLAQWLFDSKNPLTARVAVNRIWEQLFGKGLVKTSDDFGNQGQMPSHPALLDYLAIEYSRNWDTKALQKMIVMSATYRQQSVITPELQARDPQNIWLARGPRYRMPAEMIRDNALVSAGLLVATIGGSSTYPYQPAALWDQLSDKVWRYQYPDATTPGELHRRSVYTVVKRTSLPPSMQIFDFPDRATCAVKRPVSSSPLQALVLMNDPQYVEAARWMAWRSLTEAGNDTLAQLVWLHRLATGRQPRTHELKLLHEVYAAGLARYKSQPQKALLFLQNGRHQTPTGKEQQIPLAAMTDVAMVLINTDEFITKK